MTTRYIQPQAFVGLSADFDASIVCTPGVVTTNLVGNVPATVSGAATVNPVRITKNGKALQFHPAGGSEGVGYLLFSPVDRIDDDATIIWCGFVNNVGAGGVNGDLATRGTDGQGNGWSLNLQFNLGSLKGQCVDSSPALFTVTLPVNAIVGSYQRVALRKDGKELTVFDWNTRTSSKGSAGNGLLRTSTQGVSLARNTIGYPSGHNQCEILIVIPHDIHDDLVWSLLANPWQVFAGVNDIIFRPQGFGPIDHVTEGSIEGPGADTTGSASHRPTNVEHETGGAPKGFQASVTGVAERDRFHVTGGSVEGFTSTVAGTSTRYRMHPVTGAVVADYATVTGDAASSSPAGVHECEGIVVASEAIVVGTALNFSKLTSSGAVKGYQSTVTGAAKNVKKHSTNGAPIGKSSQVIGTAARLDPLVDHGTFGEVDGYQSSVTGSAVNQGSMTLTPADIAAIVAALKAEILPVNIVRVNHIDVDGTGADSDPWGPV